MKRSQEPLDLLPKTQMRPNDGEVQFPEWPRPEAPHDLLRQHEGVRVGAFPAVPPLAPDRHFLGHFSLRVEAANRRGARPPLINFSISQVGRAEGPWATDSRSDCRRCQGHHHRRYYRGTFSPA